MKSFKISLLVIFISVVAAARLFAQEGMEDVVYLKNGSIYRGMIIEQVPNVSLKIQTAGGNVQFVTLNDVTKITKEQKYHDAQSYHYGYGMHGMYGRDSMHRDFHPKRKGYFLQTQLLIENLQGGVRVVNGYKFGRFGYLGIGIGADFVFNAPFVRSNNGATSRDLRGTYLPLYIYYSGDILKKRFTPFYAIEAGVAMAHRTTNGNFFDGMGNMNPRGHSFEGGAMGSAGIGLKLNTMHRVHFSVLFNMNFKNVNYNETATVFDINGNPQNINIKNNAWMVFPGIRLGIGF